MMLDTEGLHVQLHDLGENDNNGKRVFPENTSDDVIIDENGRKLTKFIPYIRSVTDNAPMAAKEIKEGTIGDTLFKYLTT